MKNYVIEYFQAPECVFVNTTIDDLAAAHMPELDIVQALVPILCAEVDARAESERAKLVTPGAGQAMEYIEVDAQAREALADAFPTAAKFPMLAASLGIDFDPQTGAMATDLKGVARSVLSTRDGWVSAAALIRSTRLRVKASLRAAVTLDEMDAALSAAVWPTS